MNSNTSTQAYLFLNLINSIAVALLALLSLTLTNIVSRIIKRKITHYNSLIVLETQLNEMIGVIKDNIYILPGYRIAIQNGDVHWGKIRTIPVDKSHLTNLSDIDLINDIFEFFYNIRKINDDIENISGGYEEIKNAYIDKKIPVKQYVVNGLLVVDKLDLVKDFQEELLEELLELMARIRIQIRKDKPLVTKIQEFFNHSSSNKISLKEFKEEKKKLTIELEESSQESRKEISKILKRRKKL